jgi:hypothetical protein
MSRHTEYDIRTGIAFQEGPAPSPGALIGAGLAAAGPPAAGDDIESLLDDINTGSGITASGNTVVSAAEARGLTITQRRKMVEEGRMTVEAFRASLEDEGYTAERIEEEVRNIGTGGTGPAKPKGDYPNLSISQLFKARDSKILTDDEIKAELKKLGYVEREISALFEQYKPAAAKPTGLDYFTANKTAFEDMMERLRADEFGQMQPVGPLGQELPVAARNPETGVYEGALFGYPSALGGGAGAGVPRLEGAVVDNQLITPYHLSNPYDGGILQQRGFRSTGDFLGDLEAVGQSGQLAAQLQGVNPDLGNAQAFDLMRMIMETGKKPTTASVTTNLEQSANPLPAWDFFQAEGAENVAGMLDEDLGGYTGRVMGRKIRAPSMGEYRNEVREYRDRRRQLAATREAQLDAERAARMGGAQFSGLGASGAPSWLAPWQIDLVRRAQQAGHVNPYGAGDFAQTPIGGGIYFKNTPGLPAIYRQAYGGTNYVGAPRMADGGGFMTEEPIVMVGMYSGQPKAVAGEPHSPGGPPMPERIKVEPMVRPSARPPVPQMRRVA